MKVSLDLVNKESVPYSSFVTFLFALSNSVVSIFIVIRCISFLSTRNNFDRSYFPVVVVLLVLRLIVEFVIWCFLYIRISNSVLGSRCREPSIKLHHTLYCFGRCCVPVLLNITFCMVSLLELFVPCSDFLWGIDSENCNRDAVFRWAYLMISPIVVYIISPDTPFLSLLLSWTFAMITFIIWCVKTLSADLVASTVLISLVGIAVLNEAYWRNGWSYLDNKIRPDRSGSHVTENSETRAVVGNIAHDLKTPLASFTSGIEYLNDVIASCETDAQENESTYSKLRSIYGEEIEQDLKHVLQSFTVKFKNMKECLGSMASTTNFMTMNINRCVDFSAMGKGKTLEPTISQVSLSNVVRLAVQIANDVQSRIPVKCAPLDRSVESFPLFTDRQWLLDNLLCLLSNATKYSSEGEVVVQVGLTTNSSGSRNGQVLRFSVYDRGPPMSDNRIKSLFEVSNQSERISGGAGLGLVCLARRLDALKGNYGISKRSDGIQGYVFWFTIPTIHELSGVSTNIATNGDLERSFSLRLSVRSVESTQRSYNILIVDDSQTIIKMTQLMMVRKTHKVQCASNGADGLRKVVDGYETNISKGNFYAPFDVVLMDLQMPVMDGCEAIRRIRAAEELYRQGASELSIDTMLNESTRDVIKPKHVMERVTTTKSLAAVGANVLTPVAQGGPNSESSNMTEFVPNLISMSRTEKLSALTVKRFHQFIIAVSASSDPTTVQRALSSGADSFISKPFTYETFVEEMCRIPTTTP